MNKFDGSPAAYRPLARRVRHLRRRVDRLGGLTAAVREAAAEGAVEIDIVARDGDGLAGGGGKLIIADHRSGGEFLALLAALRRAGTATVSVVSLPFSATARILEALGPGAALSIIPVVPGPLTSAARGGYRQQAVRRRILRGLLPSRDRAATLNERSMREVAERLAKGELVVIFPTGAVVDALRHPWRRGLGTALRHLPPEAREQVHVVFARFDAFSRTALLRRLLGGRGSHRPARSRKPYVLTLRIGDHGAVADLVGGGGTLDTLTDEEIVARLRRRYLAAFARVVGR